MSRPLMIALSAEEGQGNWKSSRWEKESRFQSEEAPFECVVDNHYY